MVAEGVKTSQGRDGAGRGARRRHADRRRGVRAWCTRARRPPRPTAACSGATCARRCTACPAPDLMPAMARTTARPPSGRRARSIGTLDAVAPGQRRPVAGSCTLDGAAWVARLVDRGRGPLAPPRRRGRRAPGAWSAPRPVVETRVRVPSGDAVHRAYARPRRERRGRWSWSRSRTTARCPFAVGARRAAARAWTAPARVDEVSRRGHGGARRRRARPRGRRARRAPRRRRPAPRATSARRRARRRRRSRRRRSAARCAGRAGPGRAASSRSPTPPRCGWCCRSTAGPSTPTALPDRPSRWRRAGAPTPARGARIEVPDARLQDAVDANICHLLLRPHGARRGRRARPVRLRRGGGRRPARPTRWPPPAPTARARRCSPSPRTGPSRATQAFADAGRRRWSPASWPRSAARRSPRSSRLGAVAAVGGRRPARRRRARAAAPRTSAVAGEAMAESAAPAPPPAPDGVEPLLELLATASPTWTWPGPTTATTSTSGAAVLVGVRLLLVDRGRRPGARAAS